MPYKKNKSTLYNNYGKSRVNNDDRNKRSYNDDRNKRSYNDDRNKRSYNGIMYTKDPVIIPYNNKNKLIRDVDLKNILSRYDVKLDVVDIDLYRQALTHKSYIKKEFYSKNYRELEKAKKNMNGVLDLQDESNERLEFLGDTVIKLIVAEYLYDRYPKEAEGFMTRLKTNIEDKRSLARFSKIIQLDEFVIISAQNENSNTGRTNEKILEDAFESFIGALFKDAGFLVCKKLLRNILENHVDYAEALYNDDNYKDQLQRYYHTIKWGHPLFKLISEKNLENNQKLFKIGLLDNNGHIIITASDHSKKKAEQKASKKALFKFGLLSEDQIGDEILEPS